MASENSPLFGTPTDDTGEIQHEAVYLRFSPTRKKVIVAIVSLAGLIPLFVSGSFIPSIPQIALDLDSTGAIISLAVSVSVLTNSIGTLFWATYSGFYGRRPVYLCSLFCMCLGSTGVASARNVPELIAFRVLQAFGTSSGLSVGMGVIGDIYKLEERGTASGIFLGSILLGAALAPLAGGVAAHYYSWHLMQAILFAFGFVMLLVTLFFLPETSHPGARGIDKLIEAGGKPRWVWLNPLECLALLRSPNIVLLASAGAFVLLTDYVLLVPLAYTIGVKYNITNEAIIGACFIPAGVGNLLGAPIAGWFSDRQLIKWRKRRGGEWVPEDRLRGLWVGAALCVPISVLLFGFVTEYIEGRLGIVLDLVCLFINGLGVDLVLAPISAYNVDILHSRSAEVMAAMTAYRGLIVSVGSSTVIPLVQSIGVARTNAISAVAAWVGYILIWSVIKLSPSTTRCSCGLDFPIQYPSVHICDVR
ncbi:unnamed protein product [Somion occarium]|uniref:Major facilitator superfamily (MFS) profile domain-containing protein n=1 Tax=Somion occarium TaxID=3059160 RepID=A0ABP1D863_9APHY